MEIVIKKMGLFLLLVILLIAFSNIFFRYLSPIKAVRLISKSMEPTYSEGDVLFYRYHTDYSLNDVIVADANRPQPIVSRIISDNEDNTFNLKGDNNAASLDFEKNISKENIKGRIIFSLNPILFYGIDYGIIIIISSIIVFLVFRKKPS